MLALEVHVMVLGGFEQGLGNPRPPVESSCRHRGRQPYPERKSRYGLEDRTGSDTCL